MNKEKREKQLNIRCEDIYNLYHGEGLSYEEIGQSLKGRGHGENLTRQRVNQIFLSPRMEKLKPSKKDVDKMVKLINKSRGINRKEKI